MIKGQYDRAIALNPNDAYAYVNRGIAYTEKKQYDRAIDDYTKAITIDQNSDIVYYNRGHVYAKKGQFGRAASDFQKACDIGSVGGALVNVEIGCMAVQDALKNR